MPAHRVAVGNIREATDRLAADCTYLGDDRVDGASIAMPVDHDAGAGSRHVERDGAPDVRFDPVISATRPARIWSAGIVLLRPAAPRLPLPASGGYSHITESRPRGGLRTSVRAAAAVPMWTRLSTDLHKKTARQNGGDPRDLGLVRDRKRARIGLRQNRRIADEGTAVVVALFGEVAHDVLSE